MYFVKSSTTATLQHWPARLVPAPRGRTGAPNLRHDRHRRDHIVGVARNDEADRNLAVVRAVGGVQRAAAAIEADFAANLALQRSRSRSAACGKRIDRLGVRTERKRNEHYAIGCSDATS